jgi:hypothetical protein
MNVVATKRKAAFTVQVKATLKAQKDATSGLVTCELRGQEHIIVPCIMIVEGVLFSSNADVPALALASEFGAVPEGWDGRPVVYNHPQVNGEAVSANRPAGWESEVIGQIFETNLDGSKLKANLWLDISRTPQVILDGIDQGQEFEVSTGLFALSEETSGLYQGQQYSTIWRNIVPDHLAILEPGSIGACSIEDGCGMMRTNNRKFEVYMNTSAQTSASKPSAKMCETCSLSMENCKCGGGSKSKKNNESAAGAAGCSCQAQTTTVAVANKRSWLNSLPKTFQLAVNKFLDKFKTNELSDKDVRAAIQTALDDLEGYTYCYIEAVFATSVIFTGLENSDYEWGMFQVDYSVAEGGAISIGSTVVEVRPETAYVPVVITGGAEEDDASMVANSAPQPLQESTMDLSKEQITQVATQVAEIMKTNATTAPVVEASSTKASTVDALLQGADSVVANQVRESVAFATNVRQNVVTNLVKKGYTEAELAGIPLATLSRMDSMGSVAAVPGVDFAANGVGQAALATNASDKFTAPTPVFG